MKLWRILHTSFGRTSSTTMKSSLRHFTPALRLPSFKHHLHLASHMSKMHPTQLPCIIMFGQLTSSKRLHVGPKWCFKDHLKTSLYTVQHQPETWQIIATNQPSWHSTIWEGKRDHCVQLSTCCQEGPTYPIASITHNPLWLLLMTLQ